MYIIEIMFNGKVLGENELISSQPDINGNEIYIVRNIAAFSRYKILSIINVNYE